MLTQRLIPILLTAVFALPLSACKKAETTSPDQAGGHEDHGEDHHDADLEGREVVANWKAQDGDVTMCPISGKKFEVDESSGRWEYEGYNFVFCCAGDCLDKVKADPDKYLGELVEQAKAEAAGGDEDAAAEPAADAEGDAGE